MAEVITSWKRREKERMVREGLPELPESTDRQAELIAARLPIPVSSVLHNRLESLKSRNNSNLRRSAQTEN